MTSTSKRAPQSPYGLNHWDYADSFTGSEAACLVLGIDPRDDRQPKHVAEPLLGRMERAYVRAQYDDPSWAPEETLHLEPLRSIAMRDYMSRAEFAGDSYRDWLEGANGRFSAQRFTRDALHEWLEASNISTVYAFRSDASAEQDGTDEDLGEPPARVRRTLLTMLGAMAKQAYKYDPKDSRSPAPAAIARACEAQGVSMSAETVRRYLRESFEVCFPSGKR